MHPNLIPLIVAVMGSAQDWAGVEFARAQFEQVQEFAQERMLDPPVPGTPREQYAWRHAAELALWNQSPPLDILPTTHVQPGQKQQPLLCDNKPVEGLVLLQNPPVETDQQARKNAWQTWHSAHQLGKRELYCVLHWAEQQLPLDDSQHARKWALWINAASGWLKGLDKHSDVLAGRYWDRACEPDQVAQQADLGLAVTACAQDRLSCCVADVRENSSAWKADLRVGDRLQTSATFAPCTQPEQLKGDPGSKVRVQVWPVGKKKPRMVTLIRDFAVVHDVTLTLLRPGYVHLRLGDFVKGTADRVRTLLTTAKKGKNPLRGVVLDLRGNTGGVLDEAIAIADLLLPSGVILKAHWQGKPDQQPVATADPRDIDVPIVAVVNRMCASACEVLTGALQDHARALVVGEHTLGKASMQRVAKPTLMAGFYVKATIGHYWTPHDRDLDGVGTLPDVELPVEVTTQFAQPQNPWAHLGQCVARRGVAPQKLAQDVAPRRRPDPWLAMAEDWLGCLVEDRSEK